MGEVLTALQAVEERKLSSGLKPSDGTQAVKMDDVGGVVAAMFVGFDIDRDDLAYVAHIAAAETMAQVFDTGGLVVEDELFVMPDPEILILSMKALFVEALAGGLMIAERRARA